jgi:hypothetical protein
MTQKMHSRVTKFLHADSCMERHSETSKYIFINPFVAKNRLNHLKVYGENKTMISFFSVQLLLSFTHLTTSYMQTQCHKPRKYQHKFLYWQTSPLAAHPPLPRKKKYKSKYSSDLKATVTLSLVVTLWQILSRNTQWASQMKTFDSNTSRKILMKNCWLPFPDWTNDTTVI